MPQNVENAPRRRPVAADWKNREKLTGYSLILKVANEQMQ